MRLTLSTACFLAALAASAAFADAPPTYLFQLPGVFRASQFAQASDGRIFVPSQDDGRVYEFLDNGALVATVGFHFDQPTGVALDDSGNVYIAEQHANQIRKFSPALLLMKTFGAPTGLTTPTNIAFSPDFSKLYVTELLGGRVSVFDRNGNLLFRFASQGSAAGQLDFPFGIVVDPLTGDLIIANEINNRVDRWSSNGVFLSSFGGPGSAPGQFQLPVGVGRDPADGSLFVTDQLNNRIQKFTPAGLPLLQWGSFGPGAGQFYNPWAVFVTQIGNIWVGDTYNYRVQVFRPGNPVPTKSVTWGQVKAQYR